MSTTETVNVEETTPIIPKTCKGGVVVNAGPDFRVEVQDVPVPEIGETVRRRRRSGPY